MFEQRTITKYVYANTVSVCWLSAKQSHHAEILYVGVFCFVSFSWDWNGG